MTDDEFACTQNISRFADRLQEEYEPRKRAVLNRLPVEAEDRYAALSSKRDFTMRKIAEVARRIDRQREIPRNLETQGMDASNAAKAFNHMLAIRSACAKSCNRLLEDERRFSPRSPLSPR